MQSGSTQRLACASADDGARGELCCVTKIEIDPTYVRQDCVATRACARLQACTRDDECVKGHCYGVSKACVE